MSSLLVDLLHGYPAVIERSDYLNIHRKKNEQRCYCSVNDNKLDNCFSVKIVQKTAEHQNIVLACYH